MPKIKNGIKQIQKRDGRIVDFDQSKITEAIYKALTATKEGGKLMAKRLSDQVIDIVRRKIKKGEVPKVEEVQDLVERVLIFNEYAKTAKSYILYREQHRMLRETRNATEKTVDMVDEYLEETDWQVKENANMGYSLQGLNHYVTSAVTKKYWLNKIYPQEIRDMASSGDVHVHNLDCLGAYCCGWDLYDLLLKGFGGVAGKVESKPPKHFQSALGQLVNFFYTLQGESAGAQAVSSFDTLLAPFIRYDGLSYKEVKQSIQEFLFNMAIPTRVGFQCPFTNVTLDINPSPSLAKQPVIIGGQPKNETYGEFQEEMNMFNKAFYESMLEGDSKGRPFSFPIPTVNITKEFDWANANMDLMWEASAKYGINYFANFIHSDMKPEDVRSMCCRLRLSNKELYKRGGGLFGANPLTGSIGVVTINLPRLGYLAKNKEDFYNRLVHIMDLAKESLDIKRKALERLTDKGLYPYSKYYLEGVKTMRGQYWGNHFSTIGLLGLNEACLNFLGKDKDITSVAGQKFANEVLDFMRARMIQYQEENDELYNLEATPAEGTSYRLAKMDKEKYPDIIVANEAAYKKHKAAPFYTNSSQLPVDFTADLFEALKLQDDLQAKYTGGTVLHGFIGERMADGQAVKSLVQKVFEKFRLPYFTVTPTFSICPSHGYIIGEHFTCPKCVVSQPCEVYSRIVGYLRPIQQWNEGKKEEYKRRKSFKT
jgi:ribonucleoside-triphosphate reductase (formate)